MKIIIDADACPVVDITIGLAKERMAQFHHRKFHDGIMFVKHTAIC
jgi:uncharacterized protein YaiI (UPF0178 family)